MGTSHKEIIDYWTRVEDECDLAVDWSDAHERCWRCGYATRLEKCHIIPKSLGGSASAENLVLLCGRCHREAPNHRDPQYMWRWLRATGTELYDTYWTIRGWKEFETMFGRKPLECVFEAGLDERALADDYRNLYKTELEKATIHFGEGRLNPSTIACVTAEVEKQLAHRHGITLPEGMTE